MMKRNFCIGSEWLYYKIYTGVKTSDVILLEKLYPIIEDLKTENKIDKWFFIRYSDPDTHLRLRFYSEKKENLPYLIARLYPVLNELLEQDVVWKVQTETYEREIERYGELTMVDSESLFCFDSELILHYLSAKSSFEKDTQQLLFSFLSIDSFLNSFSVSNSQKLLIMDNLQLSFKKEFDADKTLKKEMDKHYRELSQEIDGILTKKEVNSDFDIFHLIEERNTQSLPLILNIKNNIQISLNEFLMSHIHMMVNRQYTSKQRMYELIIYDHLFRYYKTLEFRT